MLFQTLLISKSHLSASNMTVLRSPALKKSAYRWPFAVLMLSLFLLRALLPAGVMFPGHALPQDFGFSICTGNGILKIARADTLRDTFPVVLATAKKTAEAPVPAQENSSDDSALCFFSASLIAGLTSPLFVLFLLASIVIWWCASPVIEVTPIRHIAHFRPLSHAPPFAH